MTEKGATVNDLSRDRDNSRRNPDASGTMGRRAAFTLALALVALLAIAVPGAFAAGGEIRGKVTDTAAAPIAGIEVCAYHAQGKTDPACAETDASGDYALPAPVPGSYVVFFSGVKNHLNYVSQYYKGTVFPGVPVEVGLEQIRTGIDAAMQEGGGVSGTVTDAATHAALQGVEVCVTSAVAADVQRCVPTSVSGEYSVIGLAAGSYSVRFRPDDATDYLPEYYNGKLSEAEATPLAVAVGPPQTGIDAELDRGGQITGLVTDADSSAPLNEIEVCAFGVNGTEYAECTETDPAGNYLLAGLPGGSFIVAFSYERFLIDTDGYLSQFHNGKASAPEADPIAVVPPQVHAGIDARLISRNRLPAVTPPSMPLAAAPAPVVKRKKCRKGTRKRKINGKVRCVKKHKHHRRKHRLR